MRNKMKRIKRAKIKLNKHENTMTVVCDTSTTNQRIRYTEIISGIAVCANEHNCNKFLREHIACIHRYKRRCILHCNEMNLKCNIHVKTMTVMCNAVSINKISITALLSPEHQRRIEFHCLCKLFTQKQMSRVMAKQLHRQRRQN